MKNKKRKYRMVIGTPPRKWPRDYTYTFGRTKDISIELGKGSACVTASIGANYDGDGVLSSTNYLFSDALRKAYLLHLIVYSEQLSFEKLAVYAGDEVLVSDAEPTVAGLIVQKRLARRVPAGALCRSGQAAAWDDQGKMGRSRRVAQCIPVLQVKGLRS